VGGVGCGGGLGGECIQGVLGFGGSSRSPILFDGVTGVTDLWLRSGGEALFVCGDACEGALFVKRLVGKKNP